MELLKIIISGVIGLIIFGAIILLPLKYKFRKELKNKSTDQLEKEVFVFEDEYFIFSGVQNTEVKEF